MRPNLNKLCQRALRKQQQHPVKLLSDAEQFIHQTMTKSQNDIMSTKAISFQSAPIHNIGRPNL
jgi:hypothetical protein